MAHDGNFGFGEPSDEFETAFAAFDFDGFGAGFFDEADGVAHGFAKVGVIAAERHIGNNKSALGSFADGASVVVPAELPPEVESRVRDIAGRAFTALGCDGMARVDFFATAEMAVLINEVNTIPGFTDISMYPKAMAASGVSYPALIDRLIEHGLSRAAR